MKMAKSKMSTGKIVLSVIAMLVGVAACIALFTNVWNFAITIGEKTSTEALGGYFEDYFRWRIEYVLHLNRDLCTFVFIQSIHLFRNIPTKNFPENYFLYAF